MRPVIIVRSSRVDKDQVICQMSNALHNFGSLTMPMREYCSFINALCTGSAASGNAGIEIKLSEHDFEKW